MRKTGVPTSIVLLLCGAALAAGCSSDPSTPEAKKAKAEALLKTMSAALSGAQSLAVDTVEARDRVRANGEKVVQTSTRRIVIKRPDAAYYRIHSDTRDTEAWYEGKKLTLAMHNDKAWARGPMPAALDDALDYLATEYAIEMPSADLFYSNPYASYDPDVAKGGWVGRETIEGAACHHLAFEGAQVDWDIWVADTPQALPCRLKITYKQDDAKPASVVTFKNWDLAPALAADAFAAKVDPGYERLYLVRAPTADPEPDAETSEQPAAAPDAAKKQ